MRRQRLTALVVASVIAGVIGCRAIVEPSILVNTVGVIVSAPVSPTLGAAAAAGRTSAASAAGPQLVYVSLPPASVPTGVRVAITNQATGFSITTPVVNGGFDPVPIGASVGDALAIDITTAAAAAVAHVRLAVSSVRPLKVVRTSPPSGSRDVPLNATIVVVFSEPIDATTLTSGAVQLLQDTTPVPGTAQFADSTHLRVEFQPAATLLAAQTSYRLVVTPALRDVNGVAVDSTVAVSFTTGSYVQPTLTTIEPTRAAPGGPAFTLTVIGTEFVPASTVNFGGTALATTFVSDTHLTAAVPAAAIATAGNLTVTVTNPAPGGGISDTVNFIVALPLAFTSVSAAAGFTCAIAAEIAYPEQTWAFCWGGGGWQLGGGTDLGPTNQTTPVPVAPPDNGPTFFGTFVSVSARDRHACGVMTEHYAFCWGGAPSSSSPYPYGPLYTYTPTFGDSVFAAVTAGGEDWPPDTTQVSFDCGLAIAGVAYCWGDNSWGQLGNPSNSGWGSPMIQAPVSGTLTFAGVSAGGGSSIAYHPALGYPGRPFACGVTTVGAAYCWGGNSSGQLGDGTTTDRPTPVAVVGVLTFAAVSTGGAHACGITTAGAAYCWGANDSGQLGDGTTTARTTPVAVVGGLSFATISAAETHTCGVTTVGTAYCWGDNSAGQLGDGTTTARTTPVAVQGGLTVKAVSAGADHTCGVTPAGVAYCWGGNGFGQLGNGTTTSSSVPVKVAGQP